MDVFVRGSGRMHGIEMQASPERKLGRSLRYYQDSMDASTLRPAQPHSSLPEGEAKESARYDRLIERLLDAGRIEGLKRAAEDAAFREALFAGLGV